MYVPHRQFVFNIPILLRIYFKYDRKILTQLCHCAKERLKALSRDHSRMDMAQLRLAAKRYPLRSSEVLADQEH